MKFLKLLASKLIAGDIATMVKAGYLSDSLELTERGERILMTILFEQNRQQMAEQAQTYLDTHKNDEE